MPKITTFNKHHPHKKPPNREALGGLGKYNTTNPAFRIGSYSQMGKNSRLIIFSPEKISWLS
jgi:hypothetical protein